MAQNSIIAVGALAGHSGNFAPIPFRTIDEMEEKMLQDKLSLLRAIFNGKLVEIETDEFGGTNKAGGRCLTIHKRTTDDPDVFEMELERMFPSRYSFTSEVVTDNSVDGPFRKISRRRIKVVAE